MVIYEISCIKKYEKFDILQCTTCQIDTKYPLKCKKVRLGEIKIRNSINQDIKKYQMHHIKQSKYNTNADINYSHQALIDKQKLRLKALKFCMNDDILYTYV